MKKAKKLLLIFLVCIIISFIFEIFVFNFKSITTITNKGENVSFSSNVNVDGDTLTVKNNDYIEIKNINEEVKNIKLDFNIISEQKYFSYKIYAQDEANKLYYKLNERYYYPNILKSKYISLDLSGKARNLKIEFSLKEDEELTIDILGLSINNKIPFDISYTRLILFSAGIFLLYIIRPKSEFYKYKINFKNKWQTAVVIFLFLIQSLTFLFAVNSNYIIKNLQNYSNHTQYQDLARSLAKGQVYLDIEPSKEIKSMKNPYDYYYRQKLIDEDNAAFEWDRAYYNEKYYVYFGIVPEVTSYLPYYLLTGDNLPNYTVIYITCILSMIGIFFLLKEIVRKYFPNTSFLLFLILYVFMTFGCGLFNILGYATLYNVPIAYALMFTFWGLYFFISSIKENKISKLRILLGALCMALVAGCRPQLLVGSFLVIPIFWDEVFKKRTLFSKKSIGATLCFVIPYIIVASLLMYYNYIRFGSVFDFGANYNITSNDMTRRGMHLGRVGLGIFSYLLQPISLVATFPFLTSVSLSTNYMGTTISETLFGGLLAYTPLLILGILFFKFKKIFPSKKLFYICLICIVSAFVIVILDTQASGILPRYISDFSWLFYLPTIIVILSIFNSKISHKYLKVIWSIILCLIIFTLAYHFLYIFQDQFLHDMINSSTEFYFKWYYLLQWWL